MAEVTATSVPIEWDPVYDAAYYWVYRPIYSSVTAMTTTYTQTGLTPNTAYEYSVQARKSDYMGSSDLATITVTTLP